jgi:peroxiredoxin
MQVLESGTPFPEIELPRLGGGMLRLGEPGAGHNWQMAVVYRGLHCPLCKTYLARLGSLLARFHGIGIEVVAVSGDPEEKAAAMAEEVGLSMPMGYGMTTDQMRRLGVYISAPRGPQETDRPFPEPALFVINDEGLLHIIDISNAPFSRPDLEALAGGLEFIRANDYPIRGTWAA